MNVVTKQEHPEIFDDGGDELEGAPKAMVECICPKCRQRYWLKMRWIGRGTPRKYCAACRSGAGDSF